MARLWGRAYTGIWKAFANLDAALQHWPLPGLGRPITIHARRHMQSCVLPERKRQHARVLNEPFDLASLEQAVDSVAPRCMVGVIR
jgi:hypothetical protein